MAKAATCLEKCINIPYTNREYSWLQFNKRVLDQAMDETNPLLERAKFLAITISNLDEFVQVRLGSLHNQNKTNRTLTENKTFMTAQEQIKAVSLILPQFYRATEEIYNVLKAELYLKGLSIHNHKDLKEEQKEQLGSYFSSYILPLLSPLVLDAKHPMIQFTNARTYLALKLVKNGHHMFGVLPIINTRDRFIKLQKGKKNHVILIEDLIYLYGPELFKTFEIKEKALIRVTRNADFEASLEDADVEFNFDFSKLVEDKVETRIHLEPLRLEYKADEEIPELKAFLTKHLGLKKNQVYRVNEYFDYNFLYSLSQFFTYQELAPLRFPAFKGATPRELITSSSLIDHVLREDIFLSYPYHSMSVLLSLLREAAEDIRVSTIKITIYRLAERSEIIEILKKAAMKGKEVTAVMELCARFDEEQNLSYTKELQEAGCTVFYGLENYKVHSKIISIVLSENDKIRYITHLGTGNYNENTANLYTDLNLITSDDDIGSDAVSFFQDLATLNLQNHFKSLLVAPVFFKDKILSEIDEQIKLREKGSIICKINSLTDLEIINKLLEASRNNVKVRLIVRGICCLIPEIPSISENIHIISIVGRFLEHSRVYCFGNNLYIASADFMTRNTNKRVEIATPIKDEKVKKKILNLLNTMLSDNVKARKLNQNGEYTRINTGLNDKKINSQEVLLQEARI